MAVTDYLRTKSLDVDSVTGTPTVGKAQPIEIAGGLKEYDGFEDGDFTSNPTWTETTGNGTVTVQQTTVKNGDDALQISTSGSGSEALQHDRGSSDSISNGDTYRTWVRASTAGDNISFCLSNTSEDVNGNDSVRATLNSNGEIQLNAFDGSGSFIGSGTATTYQSGNWYRLEISFDVSNSEATLKVYDGGNGLVGQVTQSTSGASSLQYVILQNQDIESSDTYWDDVSYSTTNVSALETGNGKIWLDWTNISSESDLAVYDQNDSLLPYEIESFDATAETAVLWCYNSWVRDGSTQAQIVYGDGPTTDVTVQEVDGFEDGDYTSSPTWSEDDTGGTASVQSSTVKEGSNALEIDTDGATTHSLYHDRSTSDSISDGDIYTTWIRTEADNDDTSYALTNQLNPEGNDAIEFRLNTFGGPRFQARTFDGSGSNIENNNFGSWKTDTWYRFEIELRPSQSEVDFRVYNEAGALIAEESNVSTSGASNLQYVYLQKVGGASDSSFFDGVSYSADSTEVITFNASEENVTGTWNNTDEVFESHMNGDMTDLSPSNNSGTINGPTSTDMEFADGLQSDGTDDTGTIPSDSSHAFNDPFTIGFTVRLDGSGSNSENGIIGKWGNQSGETDQFLIWHNTSDDTIDAFIEDSVDSTQGPVSSSSLNQGELYQVFLRHDSNQNLELLVDAVQEDSLTHDNSLNTLDSEISVFHDSTGPDQFFEGGIDELYMSDTYKDDAWIQAHKDASPKAGQTFFSQSAEDTTPEQTDTATLTGVTANPVNATETSVTTENASTTSVTASPLTGSETSTSTENSGVVNVTANTLTTSETTTVNGTVTDAQNNPVNDAEVIVIDATDSDPANWTVQEKLTTNASGEYTTSAYSPGTTLHLMVQNPGNEDADSENRPFIEV